MKKVKHILVTFFHSVIPLDIYYPKLLHTRFIFSVKYYFFIVFFFAALFSTHVIYRVSPFNLIELKNTLTSSLLNIPDNITIQLKNGMLELNQEKPLMIWTYHNNLPFFFSMIYTKNSENFIQNTPPLIYFGQDKMTFSLRNKSFSRPYDHSANIFFTKDTIVSFIKKSNIFSPFLIVSFYIIFLIMLPIIFVIYSSVCIILASIFCFLIFKTYIPHLHIKKCIQASMHGTHIPLTISVILIPLFPYAFNCIVIVASFFFIFTLVSIFEMYYKEGSYSKGR